LNFYYDSRGSLTETKNHLIYRNRVSYFTDSAFKENVILIEDIWKELNSLINSLYRTTQPCPNLQPQSWPKPYPNS